MDYSGWFALGCKRIDNILSNYICCTERQFEMKISEAGPYNQRVEPIILTECIRYKLDKGDITLNNLNVNGSSQKLYVIPKFDGRKFNPRKKKLESALGIYTDVTSREELCGNILEYMISQSVAKSDRYDSLMPIFENRKDGVYKTIDPNIITYNQKIIFNKSPLDGILFHKKTGISIGLEMKNKREWKYPTDFEIWHTIAKCASINILPVFVARKIPAITKFLFAEIGVLGLETQFQFIHSSKKASMVDVVNKKYLGYSDIKFTESSIPHMDKFFVDNIPNNIEVYYDKFMRNKDVLYHYASDQNLASKSLRGIYRTKVYKELKKELNIDLEPSLADEH